MRRALSGLGVVLAALVFGSGCRVTGLEALVDARAEEALPSELKVLVWNVQKSSNPQLPGDLGNILRDESPSIVFLQEASSALAHQNLIGGYFAPSWRYPWPRGETIGVLTGTSARALTAEKVPTRWREFFVTAPKMSLATRYRLPNGEELLAVNVHCLVFERWGTMKLRSQLAGLKRVMAEHSGPILFAGDFNTWSHKRLALVREVARDLGLDEVAFEPDSRTTVGADSALVRWLSGCDRCLALDRVFYRGLTVEGAKVLDYDSSDHVPLVVSFSVNHPS